MNVQQTKGEQGYGSATLVGREAQLATFQSLLRDPFQKAPLLVSGPAGIGKTALLKAFEAAARIAGWRVVTDIPIKGLAQRMCGTYLPALHESLTGQESPTFWHRSLCEQIQELGHLLQEQESGLLITLDHLRRSSAQHLAELTAALAVVHQQKLPVYLVVAGRTAEINDLLDSSVLTELGVCEHLELGALTRAQTEVVIREALASCPTLKSQVADKSLLSRACLATQGHPYMVSLIAEAIKQMPHEGFSEHELTCGIASAQEILGDRVLAPMLSKLSAGDQAFLMAMAQDEGPSKMSDISARLGKNPQYAGVYRNRLMESQIIRSASYGKVTFVLPHLRDYLRASLAETADESFN